MHDTLDFPSWHTAAYPRPSHQVHPLSNTAHMLSPQIPPRWMDKGAAEIHSSQQHQQIHSSQHQHQHQQHSPRAAPIPPVPSRPSHPAGGPMFSMPFSAPPPQGGFALPPGSVAPMASQFAGAGAVAVSHAMVPHSAAPAVAGRAPAMMSPFMHPAAAAAAALMQPPYMPFFYYPPTMYPNSQPFSYPPMPMPPMQASMAPVAPSPMSPYMVSSVPQVSMAGSSQHAQMSTGFEHSSFQRPHVHSKSSVHSQHSHSEAGSEPIEEDEQASSSLAASALAAMAGKTSSQAKQEHVSVCEVCGHPWNEGSCRAFGMSALTTQPANAPAAAGNSAQSEESEVLVCSKCRDFFLHMSSSGEFKSGEMVRAKEGLEACAVQREPSTAMCLDGCRPCSYVRIARCMALGMRPWKAVKHNMRMKKAEMHDGHADTLIQLATAGTPEAKSPSAASAEEDAGEAPTKRARFADAENPPVASISPSTLQDILCPSLLRRIPAVLGFDDMLQRPITETIILLSAVRPAVSPVDLSESQRHIPSTFQNFEDVDAECKVHIELSEVFADASESSAESGAKKVLVYGRPGMGKTTFCHKLISQFCVAKGHRDPAWSDKDPMSEDRASVPGDSSDPAWTKKFDFVFFLEFRDKVAQSYREDDIVTLIHKYGMGAGAEALSVEQLADVLKQHAGRTLVILDNFDRAKASQLSSFPAIASLLSGSGPAAESVPGASVLVTSTPTRDKDMCKLFKPTGTLELSGLDVMHTLQMCWAFLSQHAGHLSHAEHAAAVQDLQHLLVKNHSLRSLATYPLFSAWLVQVCMQLPPPSQFPTSYTEIMGWFILHAFKRFKFSLPAPSAAAASSASPVPSTASATASASAASPSPAAIGSYCPLPQGASWDSPLFDKTKSYFSARFESLRTPVKNALGLLAWINARDELNSFSYENIVSVSSICDSSKHSQLSNEVLQTPFLKRLPSHRAHQAGASFEEQEYVFLHPLCQHYFAAYHLYMHNSFTKELAPRRGLELVWRFLSGFLKENITPLLQILVDTFMLPCQAANRDEKQLRALILACLADSGASSDDHSQLLEQCFKGDVVLERCGLGPAEAKVLGQLLKHVSAERVDLSDNHVGSAGLEGLAHLAGPGQVLRVLCLENCGIDDEGVSSLCKAMSGEGVRLEELYLGGNPLASTGFYFLTQVLKNNVPVRLLDLRSTNLKDDHFAELGQGLAANTQLETLFCDHNHIGSKGASKFSKQMRANTTLCALSMNENLILQTALVELTSGIRSHETLLEVGLGSNKSNRSLRDTVIVSSAFAQQKKPDSPNTLSSDEGGRQRLKHLVKQYIDSHPKEHPKQNPKSFVDWVRRTKFRKRDTRCTCPEGPAPTCPCDNCAHCRLERMVECCVVGNMAWPYLRGTWNS